MNTRIIWNVIVLQEKSQSGMRKLNHKQERFCGFVSISHVLIFAVIGDNTINIPEIPCHTVMMLIIYD